MCVCVETGEARHWTRVTFCPPVHTLDTCHVLSTCTHTGHVSRSVRLYTHWTRCTFCLPVHIGHVSRSVCQYTLDTSHVLSASTYWTRVTFCPPVHTGHVSRSVRLYTLDTCNVLSAGTHWTRVTFWPPVHTRKVSTVDGWRAGSRVTTESSEALLRAEPYVSPVQTCLTMLSVFHTTHSGMSGYGE